MLFRSQVVEAVAHRLQHQHAEQQARQDVLEFARPDQNQLLAYYDIAKKTTASNGIEYPIPFCTNNTDIQRLATEYNKRSAKSLFELKKGDEVSRSQLYATSALFIMHHYSNIFKSLSYIPRVLSGTFALGKNIFFEKAFENDFYHDLQWIKVFFAVPIIRSLLEAKSC